MNWMRRYLNFTVAALLLAVMNTVPAGADQQKIDQLLEKLADPDQPGWEQIEENVWIEWSKSGSPAMDLLLKRGRDALEAEDLTTAIEHFTALTDHAPDFAEGWNSRATAFFRAEKFGPSLDDIRRTLALNPDHFGALGGLGFILEELGLEKEALEAFEASAAIHPHREGINDAIKRLTRRIDGRKL